MSNLWAFLIQDKPFKLPPQKVSRGNSFVYHSPLYIPTPSQKQCLLNWFLQSRCKCKPVFKENATWHSKCQTSNSQSRQKQNQRARLERQQSQQQDFQKASLFKRHTSLFSPPFVLFCFDKASRVFFLFSFKHCYPSFRFVYYFLISSLFYLSMETLLSVHAINYSLVQSAVSCPYRQRCKGGVKEGAYLSKEKKKMKKIKTALEHIGYINCSS